MRKLILAAVLVLVSAPAFAQVTKPGDKFGWEIPTTPLATAQAYSWDLDIDGVITRITPASVTCVATAIDLGVSPTCETPIPAITPTQHTARLRAVDTTISTTPALSDWSAPFTFTMRALPATPLNIRIVPLKP